MNLSNSFVYPGGKVYLVLGSDTAIWDGMDVGTYYCTYKFDLYTNASANAYKVMDPAFRAKFVDSYGQPLKMTWWMMAGNIFRYATNRNVPIPNLMTLHLMKQYQGGAIQKNGDELSLHYHTFAWTDYNSDGIWWWNQAKSFVECKDDFDYTLCQFLLEENVFPVSFRSGWHFMDNDWQNYLDELLPYSMHNDWPVHGIDTTEPLDNNYDWSQAPKEFVPFHPSPENYQRPGNCRGWNLRSAHFSTARANDLLPYIFQQANQGIDQVACLWGHLPETDFLDNIGIIDSLAHQMAKKYPNVKFRYCTAIEAMQRWRQLTDPEAPLLSIEECPTGDNGSFIIKTNEPIFQRQPFVAVKDIYERYFILPCQTIGEHVWQTVQSLPRNSLAKVGVAVCDTVGNQSTNFIQYLPDDIYVDNGDAGFVEERGNWSTSSKSAWGEDARIATLAVNDTATVKWIPEITQSGYYNIFVQTPAIENPAGQIIFKIYTNGDCVNTAIFNQPLPAMDWVYIETAFLNAQAKNFLEMTASGSGQAGKVLAADVAKFSALVRERDLSVDQNFISLGEVSQDDTVTLNLKIANRGYKNLTLFGCSSVNQYVFSKIIFPIAIPGMSSISLPLQFYSHHIGMVIDTLLIQSDDPMEPNLSIPLTAKVASFFIVIDNDDSLNYKEFGKWYTSNAQAYGPSSRYGVLNQIPPSSATFSTTLNINGVYEIFEIVPSTINASNYAVYVLSIADVVVDSIVIDQNKGSGSWVSIGRCVLPAGYKVNIKVVDTGKNTNPNSVLRADAIKLALLSEISDVTDFMTGYYPLQFQLGQNYPNPFNASTAFNYTIPKETKVQLKIFNLLGEEVVALVDEQQAPGFYTISWNTGNLASGIYLYQLKIDANYQVRKLTIIK